MITFLPVFSSQYASTYVIATIIFGNQLASKTRKKPDRGHVVGG